MGGETAESAKLKSTYPKLSEKPIGQWIPNLYKDRISQFYSGGQYEGKNLKAYAPLQPGELVIVVNAME